MAEYAQTDRLLTIESSLGTDVLLIEALKGEESVSRPFRYELTLLSNSDAVTPEKLLRLPVAVTITTTDGGKRVVHGIVQKLVETGQLEGFKRYRAVVVPWCAFLASSFDCKIYQEQSALEIIKAVFNDLGHSDFQDACSKTYRTREYCVQYRESHLAFVSRLMEEEGIFYFFTHTATKHTLVLADSPSAVKPGPQPKVPMQNSTTDGYSPTIRSIEIRHSAHPGSVVLDDYDFEQATSDLISEAKAKADSKGKGEEEVYDYPGGYRQLSDGKHYAVTRMEATEALEKTVAGSGGAWGLVPGHKFTLIDHVSDDANGDYHILSVRHSAEQYGFDAGFDPRTGYVSNWTAIPADVPFRPFRTTPRPAIHGAQTALVVGKSGEEIWVDKHGRVKVQFHWDREGKKDESSSCWVRVATSWAGKGWGAIRLPRIGQEVVVEFLEGDPDRPLITGSVYNSENTVPYTLPANQTQSGVKSRSTKGGGTDNFNELRFEDKKGEEEVFLQAEKDWNTEVKNDRKTVVKNNNTREVTEGNELIEVKKGNQTVKIAGKQEVTVAKDQVIKITSGDRKVTVDQGGETVTISMGDQVTEVKMGKITMSAMQALEMEVGGASITMDPMSITLKAMNVKIEGDIGVEIKGGVSAKMEGGVAAEVKGGVTTDIKGTMTNVKGDAMVTVKGGIAMIN